MISGIPEGCKYTVEEVDDESGEYTQKSTDGITGTITANKTLTAKIVNTINATNLTLTKNAELYKKTKDSADFVKVTDSNDADLKEWLAEDFKFTVTFTNLVKGQKYSYQIGTGEFFVAKENVTNSDELSFTLTNKEEPTYSLSICKLVTGNFGNKAKDYTFEIEFTDSTGKPISATGFTMQVTDLNDSTSVRNRTYTLEVGKLSVDIPHGKKVTFLSLPQGTRYKITEINADSYAIHSGTYTGDALDVKAADLTGGKEQNGLLNSNIDYLYINERQGNIPTGIDLSMMAPVIVAVLILGYFTYYCIQKRKRDFS